MDRARRASIPACLAFALTCHLATWNPASAHTLLIAPNGGESLRGGQIFTIDFIVELPHPTLNWDLWYSVASDTGPWTDIVMNLPAGDLSQGSHHFYNWTVPNISASQAWVRVRQDASDGEYFDVSDAPFSIQPSPTCDFSGDGQCNIVDLNALLAVGPIAPGVPVVPGVNNQFDLDGNGVLDLRDRDRWLTTAATQNGLASPYKLGDANLSGAVDGTDFNAWNGRKFTTTLRWDHGNFNGDPATDGADFNLWNANKFQSSDSGGFVPEPIPAIVLWLLLWIVKART